MRVLQSLAASSRVGDPYNRQLSMTPGVPFDAHHHRLGGSVQVDWDLGGANLTSITAYRGYKAAGPGDVDYGQCRHPLPRRRRRDALSPLPHLHPGTPSAGLRLQRLHGLAGRRLFRQRGPHVSDNLTFGTQYGAFAACRLVATINSEPGAAQPRRAGLPQRHRHRDFGRRLRHGRPDLHRRLEPPQHGQCRRQRRQIISRTATTGRSSPHNISTSTRSAFDHRPALYP